VSLFRKEALRHRYETGWATLETGRRPGMLALCGATLANAVVIAALLVLAG
jgi:hypothetical protein